MKKVVFKDGTEVICITIEESIGDYSDQQNIPIFLLMSTDAVDINKIHSSVLNGAASELKVLYSNDDEPEVFTEKMSITGYTRILEITRRVNDGGDILFILRLTK